MNVSSACQDDISVMACAGGRKPHNTGLFPVAQLKPAQAGGVITLPSTRHYQGIDSRCGLAGELVCRLPSLAG